MDNISPQTTYDHLAQLESVDVMTSAVYRQEAQDVLADPAVSLNLRQAIADRLNQANHQLELKTVLGEESY